MYKHTPHTLDQLLIGQCATVDLVQGDDAVAQRLAEMGMVAGARVAMIRCAPLGDPLEIELDGYHLSLRRTEAAKVLIHL